MLTLEYYLQETEEQRTMKTAVLFAAVLLVAFASLVHGRSSGAPNEACPAVSPDPSGHGAGPQTTPSPYSVFGLPFDYIPLQTYECKSGR